MQFFAIVAAQAVMNILRRRPPSKLGIGGTYVSEQRLIDANAFIQSLIHCKGLGRQSLTAVLEHIEKQPIIEAKPVKHGKWEEIRNANGELEGWLCKCGREVKSKENYCPNCGARMDGGNTWLYIL